MASRLSGAGEIELVFRGELRNRLKLIGATDNGGYFMTPFVPLVRVVLNRIRDTFEDLHCYYFHSGIHGIVYDDPSRTKHVCWRDLVKKPADTWLPLIGSRAPRNSWLAGTADVTKWAFLFVALPPASYSVSVPVCR